MPSIGDALAGDNREVGWGLVQFETIPAAFRGLETLLSHIL